MKLKNKNTLLPILVITVVMLLLSIFFKSYFHKFENLVNSSIFGCTRDYLSDEQQEWFDVYQKGETIKFRSNRGNLNTMKVTKKGDYFDNESCNWLELGREQSQHMWIELQPSVCHGSYRCLVSIYMESGGIAPNLTVFDINYQVGFETLFKTLKKQSIFLSGIQKGYDDVYFVEGDKDDLGGNNPVTMFYWDKNDGLIKYITKDGEEYELVKNN